MAMSIGAWLPIELQFKFLDNLGNIQDKYNFMKIIKDIRGFGSFSGEHQILYFECMIQLENESVID